MVIKELKSSELISYYFIMIVIHRVLFRNIIFGNPLISTTAREEDILQKETLFIRMLCESELRSYFVT